MNPLFTIKHGSLLREDARFPVQFIGNWQEVVSSPTIDVMVDGNNVKWSEGPLWMHDERAFYFSDPVQAKIFRLGPKRDDRNDDGIATKLLEVWAIHSGGVDETSEEYKNLAEPGSNGMASDPNNPSMVYICQHPTHRVIRCRLKDHKPGLPLNTSKYEVIARTDPNGKHLNSPNDVIVDSRGYVWFTDPIYGLLEKDRFCDKFNKAGSYLDNKSNSERSNVKGVYRVDPNTKEKKLATPFHRRPNGLAFTHDQNTLWIADSTIGHVSWTAYDLRKPKLTRRPLILPAKKVITQATLAYQLGSKNGDALLGTEGLSDGFKIDHKNRIWSSIPNGFCVIDISNIQQPRLICQILLGVNCSNVAFGSDGQVWLTGSGGVWRIQMKRN